MNELARELEVLRDELAPVWDDARSARLYAGVGRLRKRRQAQHTGAMLLTGALLCTASWLGVRGHGLPLMAATTVSAPTRVQPSTRPLESTPAGGSAAVAVAFTGHVAAGQSLRLSDGSLVQVSATGSLEVARNQPGHIELRLVGGAAHFSVVPDHERQFVVDAGSVQVAVVGTVFDVEQVSGGVQPRVRVAVVEGKVRVSAADGEHFVGAGESVFFGAAGAAGVAGVASVATVDGRAALRAEHVRRVVHRDAAAKTSWRSLSQAGDYEQAYSSLSAGGVVEDDPATLMDAADAARLSGHPDVALGYLRRVVRDHRGSPVAPLAAFTLGRVQLERLGQPSEAAESFAQARTLAPHGSLAQDALAREVEALSKAGNAHEAYLRAQQYVQAYPAGRRLHAVRLYGGLE
ncbi:MAG TPA: FecR domain-containing protein [Polyangiales bacterium]